MRKPLAALVAVIATAALLLTGCGGDQGSTADTGSADSGATPVSPDDTAASTPGPTDSPTDSPTATVTQDDDQDDQGDNVDVDDGVLEIDIDIEDGTIEPAGQRVRAKVGQTIRLDVDSDMADELHLHADPGKEFEVRASDDQVFEFTIDQPGVYELESHGLETQVVSIQVEP